VGRVVEQADVADVGVVSAPPIRKNTSEIRSGLPAAPFPGVPTETSTGELTRAG
jgi:hypothetical protein